MRPRDLFSYLFLALAWGLSFLLLLTVVQAFGWAGAVTFRCFIAAAILLVLARITRRRLAFPARLAPLAVVGATTVAGQLIGLSFATPRIGTAMAAIFVASIPLFSMVISRLWGMEAITPTRILGLVLGTIGLVMLVGFPAVPVTAQFLYGCAAMLVSTFSAAFGSNYANRFLAGTGAWEVTIGAFLSGGVMTLPLLIIVPVPGTPLAIDYLALFALAGLMSALTYVLYFGLVSSIGATRAISVEFAVTVVAVLVGALVLDEPLSLLQVAGGVVIMLGCALVLGLIRGRSKIVLQPQARA
ncbi:DMT family transporter [Rhizobium sp. SSA_523]|uniref:DMT family transporter n=1 Tax=Rhizobium sp. SSA_523 TaxID=2952477 RepID=UPI00208FFB1F|nr:DMT family transporter [Rhizobium sp. SSA_523]MCO5730793.1 DMT family transporter [Rhizobium sp. SSA_523]WKC24384.1 DMT family transporter [Rhizobium sp. SSA_523]